MKEWIIALLIIGLIVGIAGVTATAETPAVSCKTSGNACTKTNNCGLESCGAIEGKPCGCGK